MRLLNASTKSVKGFVDSILQYTVLSHTWDTDEITYQDILAPGGTVNKAGWAKVHGVCEKAKEHGYEYIWIDTCCIDKSSSAELSEAINSMLKWYRYAEVCYAYLSDMVPAKGGTVLSNGRWFTRGWTLQELIAPERMGFYNADWNYIGEKESFADQISTITGIPKTILVDAYSLWSTSIACRMSWAAKRKTTRVEDMAYYLVGLFGVNMPLLYGEGEKAFLRLQEEIIKISDDQSILAWDLDTNPYRVSVLAQTPFDFLNSSNIIPIPRNPDHGPFTMTHMGLSIRLPMFPTGPDSSGKHIQTGVLECQIENNFAKQIGIYLRETVTPGISIYERCVYQGSYIGSVDPRRVAQAEVRSLYIVSHFRSLYKRPTGIFCRLSYPSDSFEVSFANVKGVNSTWDPKTLTMRLGRTPLAFTHDIAAGFLLSLCRPYAPHVDAIFIVILFPLGYPPIPQLNGIQIYKKPADWPVQQSITTCSADLSAAPNREYVSERRVSAKYVYKRNESKVDAINVYLKSERILNQLVYKLDINIT